jgi:hypothetical protein
MPQQPEPARQRDPIITRGAIATRIEARLAGQLADAALAAWAFDRFYAAELGSEQFEAGAEQLIADALDALMFGDEPAARLDEEELRAVIAQLGKL